MILKDCLIYKVIIAAGILKPSVLCDGIPEFLDSGRWTLNLGRWTLDAGLRTLNARLWTLKLVEREGRLEMD